MLIVQVHIHISYHSCEENSMFFIHFHIFSLVRAVSVAAMGNAQTHHHLSATDVAAGHVRKKSRDDRFDYTGVFGVY